MKKSYLVSVLLAASCLGGVTNAFAQACSANLSIAAPSTVAGNNCGNNATLANICSNGISLNLAGVDIYSIPIGAAQNFTFSVTSAAFTPQIAFIGSPCSSNANCIDQQTIAAAGTATSGTITGNAAGTYFILVGDSAADNPGCGAYNLTVNPTLPVKLQDFSIQ